MRFVKILGILIGVSCGVLLTNNAAVTSRLISYEESFDNVLPKCFSKESKTLFDLLMKVDITIFDDIASCMYNYKAGNLYTLSPTKFFLNTDSQTGLNINHVENGFFLDFGKSWVINTLILIAVFRNIPNFVVSVLKATSEGKIIISDPRSMAECIHWSIILRRDEILYLLVETLPRDNKRLAHAALEALPLAAYYDDASWKQKILNNQNLKELLKHNSRKDIKDILNYYHSNEEIKNFLESCLLEDDSVEIEMTPLSFFITLFGCHL